MGPENVGQSPKPDGFPSMIPGSFPIISPCSPGKSQFFMAIFWLNRSTHPETHGAEEPLKLWPDNSQSKEFRAAMPWSPADGEVLLFVPMFYCSLTGFHGDLMGSCGDLMGSCGDLMGIISIYGNIYICIMTYHWLDQIHNFLTLEGRESGFRIERLNEMFRPSEVHPMSKAPGSKKPWYPWYPLVI